MLSEWKGVFRLFGSSFKLGRSEIGGAVAAAASAVLQEVLLRRDEGTDEGTVLRRSFQEEEAKVKAALAV